jgi:hypothetical protein
MCVGHPVEDMFGTPSFVSGGFVRDFGEGGHMTGGVPEPTSGFICVDSLHVALLRVLAEGIILGTFEHRAMEGSDAITPLPGAHRG